MKYFRRAWAGIRARAWGRVSSIVHSCAQGGNHLEVTPAQRARELLGFISQELSRSVTLTGQDLWCKSYFSFCKGRPCYLHGHGH